MMKSRFLACALLVGLLGGCSVGMALSGSETPDISIIKIGTLRDDVELHFGKPAEVEVLEDGTERATYVFEVGNDPSVTRAVGHAVLDVASFGLWEAIGTPIEAYASEERMLLITYNKFDLIKKVERIN